MIGIGTTLGAMLLTGAGDATATVEVDLSGLRNAKGLVHICLTKNPAHFPDCKDDPAAIRRSVAASIRQIRFADVPAGRYAVTLVHDQNKNGKLDTLLGIPREGFGFSRNPVIRFGPPRFDSVGIDVRSGFNRASVRMQYLL